LPVLREKTGLYNNVSPTNDFWLQGASGHSGLVFSAVANMKSFRAELFIRTADVERTKRIYQILQAKKSEIEEKYEFAKAWDWNENPKTCNIGIRFTEYGLTDEEHWDSAIEFLADSVADLVKAFKPLINAIERN
jgi:hypothetical protein